MNVVFRLDIIQSVKFLGDGCVFHSAFNLTMFILNYSDVLETKEEGTVST
jgi:hypothetical protein